MRTVYAQGLEKGPIPAILASVLGCALMVMVYRSLSVHIEARDVPEVAVRSMARELAVGLALGFGLYSLCIVILMALGVYRLEGFNDPQILLVGLAGPLATGFYEELLFRGGVFRLAQIWFGSWAAIVINALVFGYVHMGSDGATLQGIASITIWAGVLLAATYLLTGRLWLGIGLHCAWNYTQGAVYSGIVSGNGEMTGFARSAMKGPDYLTGGSFGVEASLVAFLVCTTTGVIMIVMAVRRGNIVRPAWAHRNVEGALPG
jgi:membrane protease YdiL (CAAX protease family)